MITHQDTYVTKLGTEFEFGFEMRNGNYVIHILSQPSYGDRDADSHVIHVICEGENRLVCWTGPMPTLDDSKIVAGLWSDFTERFILTGEHFPTI